MSTQNFTIRPMQLAEMALAADWAAAEGWNPGLADPQCFAVVDPQGFWIGELNGQPAATISLVNYDEHFAFLGFYIVRPDRRGQGLGWQLWQSVMPHAGKRTIGLDGVLAQQANYQKSGFRLAHHNSRYGGTLAPNPTAHPALRPLADIPLAILAADDATVFPAPRTAFLQAWRSAPGHQGWAYWQDNQLHGWGVIRPCRQGYKVGPLFANTATIAATIFDALVATVGGGEIFLDVPQPHRAAVALAEARGLQPVFTTARMYTGAIRPIQLERIFGITTFELG